MRVSLGMCFCAACTRQGLLQASRENMISTQFTYKLNFPLPWREKTVSRFFLWFFPHYHLPSRSQNCKIESTASSQQLQSKMVLAQAEIYPTPQQLAQRTPYSTCSTSLPLFAQLISDKTDIYTILRTPVSFAFQAFKPFQKQVCDQFVESPKKQLFLSP